MARHLLHDASQAFFADCHLVLLQEFLSRGLTHATEPHALRAGLKLTEADCAILPGCTFKEFRVPHRGGQSRSSTKSCVAEPYFTISAKLLLEYHRFQVQPRYSRALALTTVEGSTATFGYYLIRLALPDGKAPWSCSASLPAFAPRLSLGFIASGKAALHLPLCS